MINTRITKEIDGSLIESLNKLRSEGDRRGRLVHLPSMQDHVSFKDGYPIVIGADEHKGKTTMTFELVLSDVIKHDKNWFIFSPETGTTEETIIELIDAMGKGKRFHKNYQGKPSHFAMSDQEYYSYLALIQSNIRILDPFEWRAKLGNDVKKNMTNLFEIVEHEEKQIGAKFDGILIDPLNELDLDGGSIAEQMKNSLTELIWYGRKTKKIIMLGNHLNELKTYLDTDIDKNKFAREVEPKTKDFQGGRQTGRKMYQVILLIRPSRQEIDLGALAGDWACKHAQENNYNLTIVKVDKSKPKGVGKVGKFPIFYDIKRNQYYEFSKEGHRVYGY